MFEFKYVELMNWAYWPTVNLPLDQRTIMITGPNGSGKTTFLDALRVLLRAPRLSSNRRFTDYIIGKVDTVVIRGVVTNDAFGRDHRPFEFKGFDCEEVTLAAILKKKSGRWERRYVIAENDISLDDIKQIPKNQQLSPEAYTYEIGEAGFSAAFLKVLALEQGQTDKLCEKSPRELLDLLLEVHGDKQVINQYKDARQNYHSANMEITQLGARLAEEQAKVLASEKAADEYRRYVKLTNEKKEFEDVIIPQSEYRQAKERTQELEQDIKDMNLDLGPVDRRILELQDSLDNADTDLEGRRSEVDKARGLKDEMEKTERDLDIKLNTALHEKRELTRLVADAKELSPENIDELLEKSKNIQREIMRLEFQIEEKNRKLQPLQQDVLELEVERRKVYPRFVEEFTSLLEQQGVKHILLCDIIDITDREWQLAVESILGRDRFTILVDKKDELNARQLAERARYRCYIVAKESGTIDTAFESSPGTALEVVEFVEDGAPSWVVEMLERTHLVEDVKSGMKMTGASVTSKGYRQDRRGGISIAVDRFYCGSMGQTSLKEDLNREINAVKSELGKLQKSLTEKREEAMQLSASISIQENIDKLQNAQSRIDELDAEIKNSNSTHKEALELKRQSEIKLIEALDLFSNFERDCNDMRKELNETRSGQSDTLNELKEIQDQIAEQKIVIAETEEKLEKELLTETALAKVEDVDEITPKYYTVRRLLSDFGETVPFEAAVEIYENHKSQYDSQRSMYEEHEEGLRKWEKEFRLARGKYVVVVEHTIKEYRTNVLNLSKISGIQAEIIMPDLSASEDSLEEAELQVRFGFDGKSTTGTAGVSLSGGQRVIASMVLLMSLATSGGVNRGGFFIIDEPFAHLSLERIDDVTRFLEKSLCQFILTSPTTHNVNVFSAARLQMNFRIKKPNEKFAPVPTIIRR
ncbi:MAG: AAA family ATPase [Lentisphaeria bacterium]|nr:AAA family ATPase [Lentisphaeria bacterium]NQZ68855.1 AAA family ATPase [Lentisphaeria bacterium]